MKCINVDRECCKEDCPAYVLSNTEGEGECVFTLNSKVMFFATLDNNASSEACNDDDLPEDYPNEKIKEAKNYDNISKGYLYA